MTQRLQLLVAVLIVLSSGTLLAQTGKIEGKVIDESTNEPLISATVLLLDKGTAPGTVSGKQGRITKRDGSFVFNDVPPGSYTLRVSYVSYKTTTQQIQVSADKTTTVQIAVTPDPQGISEIVVTGVASRKSKSISEVSVSRVDAAELTDKNNYQDLSQLLSGKAPGVTVSTSSGNVGGGIRFNVRTGAGLYGNGQPIILVDGVRINNGQLGSDVGGQFVSALADLNPEDIAKVEILKGPAATALYGTSGSNGVVLVTTKRGNYGAGRKPTVNLRTVIGVNEQAVKYTPEMALSYNDANAVFRRGDIHEYELSVGGGSGDVSYYTSFGNRYEQGLLYGNDMERNSVRANLSAAPSEHMTINVNTNYISSQNNRTQNDNTIAGPLAETLTFGPNPDGTSGSYPDVDSASIAIISDPLRSERFIGSVEITSDIVDNLLLRGLVGYDALSTREDYLYPADGNYENIGITQGSKTVTTDDSKRLNFDLSAAYNYEITDGLMATSTIGAQGFTNTYRYVSIQKDSFPSYRITNLQSGSKFRDGNDIFSDAREAGIFFQQDLSLDDNTYNFGFGLRNDYSSAIGRDAPNIFYPNVRASVRLDKLDLFPKDFNMVKVRAAYGRSGILPGPLDAAELRWSATPSGSGPGAVIGVIGNPAIEPESVGELEAGFEVELDNSYGIDFTYYQRMADNSIIDFRNPPSTGLTATSVPRNVGAIKSWGFESHLYGTPIRSRDYQLDLDLIWNYQDNEVTDLGGAQPIFDGYNINVIAVGLSRSAFYGQKVVGALFDDATGAYLGPDVEESPSYLGTPIPNHTGSFSVRFKFLGDFTFSALSEWALGQSTLNLIHLYTTIPFYQNNREYAELATQLGISAEVGSNPVPDVAPLEVGSDAYRAAAERFAHIDPSYVSNFVEKSDYFRLREISLTYDLTNLLGDVTDNVIKNMGITLSVRNLLLLTNYSFPDPEINADGARSLTRGLDFGTLQNPRTLSAMLTIGF